MDTLETMLIEYVNLVLIYAEPAMPPLLLVPVVSILITNYKQPASISVQMDTMAAMQMECVNHVLIHVLRARALIIVKVARVSYISLKINNLVWLLAQMYTIKIILTRDANLVWNHAELV